MWVNQPGTTSGEKKLTLPLIHTLNTTDPKTRRQLVYIMKNENKDPEKIRYVIDTVNKSGNRICRGENEQLPRPARSDLTPLPRKALPVRRWKNWFVILPTGNTDHMERRWKIAETDAKMDALLRKH